MWELPNIGKYLRTYLKFTLIKPQFMYVLKSTFIQGYKWGKLKKKGM
jgi:hypothetical protein